MKQIEFTYRYIINDKYIKGSINTENVDSFDVEISKEDKRINKVNDLIPLNSMQFIAASIMKLCLFLKRFGSIFLKLNKIFLIVFLIFGSSPLFSNELKVCEDAEIDHHLNRANTYFWLSRNRQNSLYESLLSKKEIDSAIVLLKQKSLDVHCIKEYMKIINSFVNELEDLQEVTYDNINGIYVLIPVLANQYKEFEFFDEPLEICLEAALAKLLKSKIYRPSQELMDVLLFTVIEVNGDPSLNEIAIQYLNSFSNMYVVSNHEKTKIIGDSVACNYDCLKILGEHYNTNFFAKLVITVHDDGSEISYVGARLEFHNLVTNQIISNTYAEGIKLDVRDTFAKFILYSLKYFLFAFLAIGVVLFLIKKRTNDAVKIQNLVASIVTGMLLGVVLSFAAIKLFSYFAPIGMAYIGEPKVYMWPILLICVLLLTPILVLILSGLLFKRRIIDSSPLIFLFLSVFTVALLVPFIKASFYYLSSPPPIYLVLIYIITALVSSFVSSKWLRESYKNRKNIAHQLIPMVSFLPIGFIFIQFLRGGININFPTLYSGLILVFVVSGLLIYILTKKYKEETLKIAGKKLNQVEEFKKVLNKQLSSKSKEDTQLIEFNKGYKEYLEGFVKNLQGFMHLHINGKAGIGKTTFINDVLKNLNNECLFYYGDCNEEQEGIGLPYEPFLEAFSKQIGSGVFYDGAASASDLITKAKPLLELAGVGSVSDVISSDEKSFKGSSVKEISDAIKSFFKKESRAKQMKKIIVVIEDLQWIDSHSQELLLHLINVFNAMTHDGFHIMLITSSSDESVLNSKVIEHSKTSAENDDGFSYKIWDNAEDQKYKVDMLPNTNFIRSFLDKNKSDIIFNPISIKQIDSFVSDQHTSVNPRYSLELLRYLIENSYIVEENFVLTVIDNMDWDKIPFEDGIEQLYFNKFNSLNENILKVLETAAFIGIEFEAELLSNIWKIDRMELIHDLLKAEKLGLIIDLNDNDDWYRFSSKSVRAALKRFSMNHSETGKIPQIVKEYHRKVIDVTLERYNVDSNFSNLNNLPDDILFQLAERMMIVCKDKPIVALQLCCEALKRSSFLGQTAKRDTYIEFLSRISFNAFLQTKELASNYLFSFQDYLSNQKTFCEGNDQKLVESLENILLDYNEGNSDIFLPILETYFTIIYTCSLKRPKYQEVLTKYESNHYIRFYQVLIDRRDNNYKFTEIQIELLRVLWDDVSKSNDNRLKGKVLQNLSQALRGEESLKYIIERLKIIIPNCTELNDIESILSCLGDNLIQLNFSQLTDIGFVCKNLSDYLNDKGLFKEKLDLNKMRLEINNKLGHSLGIFTTSIEIISNPISLSSSDLFDFTHDLFYKYSEGIYRIQIYPIWLKNAKKSNLEEELERLKAATLIMEKSFSKSEFLKKEDLKVIPNISDLLKELIYSNKLNNDEKQVIQNTINFFTS